jgi:hypothetical protein
MFLNLLEKLNYEHDKYNMYLDLVSRADFKGRAYEIACKNAIYERLLDAISRNEITEPMERKMLAMEDVVDVIYLKGSQKNNITLKRGSLTETSWSQLMTCLDFLS